MIVNKNNVQQGVKPPNVGKAVQDSKPPEQYSKYVTVSPEASNLLDKWGTVVDRFTEDLHPTLKQDKKRKMMVSAVLENSYKELLGLRHFLHNWQNEIQMNISESVLNGQTILTAFKRVMESAGVTTPSITSGTVATFLAPIIIRTLYKMNAVDMFEVQPLDRPVGVFNYAVFEYEIDTKEYPHKTFVNLPGQMFTINPYYSMNVFEVRVPVVISTGGGGPTASIYSVSGVPQIFPEPFRNAVTVAISGGRLYIALGRVASPPAGVTLPTNSLEDISAIHNLPQTGFFFQQKPQYVRVMKSNDPTATALYNVLNWEFYVKDRQYQGLQIHNEEEKGIVVSIPLTSLDTNGNINYIRILYTTDYEQFGKNPPIPSIGLKIEGIPVSVEQRPIRAKYTLEAERDLSAYFKMNIYETLTNFLVAHIAGEIDRRLIFEAFRSAYRYIPITLNNLIGAGSVINYQSIRDVLYTIALQIQVAANDILRFNKIAKGNWVVTSTTTGALLEALSKTEAYVRDIDVTIPQASTLTPTKVGRVGDIDVYVDPMLPDGIFLIGTKVPNDIAPFGGGVALLPYSLMPAHYDDLGKPVIAPDTFVRHIGFVSRDAIVTVPFGNYFYAVVEITDIDRISDFLGNLVL